MVDNSDALLDLMKTNTQYQAAKFGSGGLLDMAIMAYQAAFPKAPAANLLAGGRQAYNIGKYNKAVQAEALRQQLRQEMTDANNAEILARRTGLKVQGPFDLTFANNAAPDLRNDANLEFNRERLRSGVLNPDLITFNTENVDNSVNEAMKRSGQLNDAQATLGMLPAWMGTPTGDMPGGRVLDAIQRTQGGLGQLSGRIAKGNVPNRVMPADAFTVGIPDVGQLLTGRNNEQTRIETNRHNTTTEKETGRHNRETEKAGMINANAHMISARKPPGGGGFSLDAALWAGMTPQ